MNRIVKKYGPGVAWQNHPVKTDVLTNIERKNAVDRVDSCFIVCRYRIKNDSLVCAGEYDAGTLEVVRTIDEDNHVSYEFKDKAGRIVLVRQSDDNQISYDTYHVYDNYGNLCMVLPPMAADYFFDEGEWSETAPVLQQYAYIYHYDKYNRCIYKKLPGCDPVYTVYDAADHPVFTQDGEQRERNEWSFSIPDAFGRTVLTGVCTNTLDYASNPLDTIVVYGDWANEENGLKGYQLKGVTLNSPSLLSANYYDHYEFLGKNGIPNDMTTVYVEETGYGKRNAGGCKGQLTGVWTSLLSARPGTFTYSVMYYDDRYRIIQQRGNNELGGTEIVHTAYNFSGNPLEEKRIHTVSGTEPIVELHQHTYDHANRLLKTSYQLNDNTPIVLVDNVYDEIGRLKTDKRNGVYELRTDYTYNLRSWIKGINGPLFNQTLNYQETLEGTTPCYNGNISRMCWRSVENGMATVIDPQEKGYSFTYDGLSRLKDAIYGEGTNLKQNRNRFNEQITGYDKMGNILGLLRYGQTGTDSYGLVDNLNLIYHGNQLQSVYDNATNSVFGNGMEFKDNVNETVEYEYDKNGNLTKDLNKKITGIQYNILNLPSHISFADGNSIEYEYAADGRKVRTTHTINNNVTSTVYCGNAIYENGSLKMLLNESGYYSFQDNKFYFYLKDHQGNIRVVADEDGKVEEVNDYYPFGGLMFNAGDDTQPYKYNGKELDQKGGLDWYDYGARYYDAAIGRWHAVDPMVEMYYSESPYVYCVNNFVNKVDPTGCFSTKFGAWLYKLFNGGDQILKDVGGEYFVSTQIVHSDDEVEVVVNRKFDWDGRNTGRNLAIEKQWDAYIADAKFQELCETHGMEYVRTENQLDAVAGMLQPAMQTIIPVPFLKSGNALINAVRGKKIITTPVIRFGGNANQVYHTFRHTDALGLDRSVVQSMIRTHFETVSSQVVAGRPFNQIIRIGGRNIQYTAFKLSDGTFNIGRIHEIL